MKTAHALQTPIRRARLATLAVLTLAVLLSSAPAGAQAFPDKPVTLIIPWSAGDAADIISRVMAETASKTLGQPIVIVNKPGGGTSIGLAALKAEKPDGYTIGYITGSGIMMQYLQKVPYDAAQDFEPIIRYIEFSTMGVVVRADAPWKSMKEFVDYAKANPGKVKYGTSFGSPHHIVMETMAKNHGIKWVVVSSKSASDAITSLLGGHIDAAATSSQWKPQVSSGQFRLLCTYGKKRSVSFPDTPTLMDLGYNVYGFAFGGLVAPKGTPPAVIARLHEAFKAAMSDPQFVKTCQQFDIDPSYNDPAGLGKDIRELHELYGKFSVEAGLKKD
jgi:tripartite-type tricarboxylate transporter receptor subunit TctC